MTITQVGAITGPFTVVNANLTVTEPTGCQENDYLVVWIAHKHVVGYQALNGWTKLQDQSIGNTDSTDGIASGELFYIKRGVSAPNLIFTKETENSDVAMGMCAAFRGIHLTDPIRASTSTTAAMGATVATATALSALIGDLCFMGLAGGDSYSFSAEQINGVPTALSELADSSTTLGADTANAVAIKVLTEAITSQTLQATASSALGRNVIAVTYFKPATASYSIVADYGSFALTGQAVGFKRTYILTAAQGVYALTGQAVVFHKGYTLAIGHGIYTLTGQTIGFRRTYVLVVAQGTYALTGQAVGFYRRYTLVPVYGIYALTGQVVGLKRTCILVTTCGFYTLSGQAVVLGRGHTIVGLQSSDYSPGFIPERVGLQFFRVSLLTPPTELEEMGLIQGKVPDSVQEWRVAQALEALHRRYYYQVPLEGGNRLRGGLIIDFVVDMPPRMVAIPVHGGYWHGGQLTTEDRWEEAVMTDAGFDVKPLYQRDLESVEQAIASTRKIL